MRAAAGAGVIVVAGEALVDLVPDGAGAGRSDGDQPDVAATLAAAAPLAAADWAFSARARTT